MKKVSLFLLYSIFPGFITILSGQKINNPKISEGVHGTEIKEVGYLPNAFYIDLDYYNEDYYASMMSFDSKNPYYVLDKATGEKYALLEALPDKTAPVKVCGTCHMTFRLKFQKIPRTVQKIDLIQGNRANGGHFYGIDISDLNPSLSSTSALKTQEGKYKGVMFDQELREISFVSFSFGKNEVTMVEHVLKNFGYRDFSPFKHTDYFKKCGNKGRFCGDDGMELDFTLYPNTTASDLDGQGLIRINGNLRYKFYVLNAEKYNIDYQFMNGELWIGEKSKSGKIEGFGALMSYQKEYSHYTERALNGYSTEKESFQDYRLGYPYFRIGKFENGTFLQGATHIYYTFNKHSYSMDGYNKLIGPIINGQLSGSTLAYKWAYDPYEDAFPNVYIGKMNGLFFADGVVNGYNFKNQLAEKCNCSNRRLSCQRLISTIEEKKFTEILGVATLAIAETALLLKLADALVPSGPSSSGSVTKGSEQTHEVLYTSPNTKKISIDYDQYENNTTLAFISILSDGNQQSDGKNYYSSVIVYDKSGKEKKRTTFTDAYKDQSLSISFLPKYGEYLVVHVHYGIPDPKWFGKDEYKGIGTMVKIKEPGAYSINVFPK